MSCYTLTLCSSPQVFVFRSLLEAIVERRCHLVAPPATPLNAPLSLAFPHSVEHVIRIALHDFQSTFGGISKELWETKAKALLEQDVNSWRTNSEHVHIRHACVLVHPRDPALSDNTHTQVCSRRVSIKLAESSADRMATSVRRICSRWLFGRGRSVVIYAASFLGSCS